ncbi:acyl-CoA N-acyltransferase [Gorgonomyces haynaldii]|nr:acyl-CoA N-acyltransferase [Gorgonomyces haynaldii]
MDIDAPEQLESIYILLLEKYVEDDTETALKPPGFNHQWHLGVRVVSNKKLVGFIAGIPVDLKIRGNKQHLVKINYLCVHKRLRSKRMAPVSTKEITRRVNLTGTFQALYTAVSLLPKLFTKCQYFHRSLNPEKLAPLSGLRPMQVKDAKPVQQLLHQYLEQFAVTPQFSEEDVQHWLLPRDGVIYSYIIEEEGQITDSHLFYYAPKGLGKDMDRLELLIRSVLWVADNHGFNVFNCSDMMHNMSFASSCHFEAGDGTLHYYLYNYRLRDRI